MKKLCAMALSLMMLVSLSVNCYAAETILPDGTIILGTEEDDEGYPGYFDDDVDVGVAPSSVSSESLRFSWKAEAVYDLLTTRNSSGKTVTLWNSSYNYRVTGQPHYTPRPTRVSFCRAGLCYYSSNSGLFETSSDWCHNAFSDETGGSVFIDRTTMTSEVTYYGFCKNLLNDDGETTYKMSGTFYVYNVPMY